MNKNKRSGNKNNYQHFKATVGAISEEVDYFGNCKEVLSLNKVHLNTKKNNPIADYAVINKNKATETLFELAHKGSINQIASFYGKIMDCRQVQLYDGLKFLQNEYHCKIGYIKNLNVHYKKRKNKVTLDSGQVIMIKNDLAIFEDHKIRRIYDKETDTWFFSVVDALTDSTNPRRYWSDLKNLFQ